MSEELNFRKAAEKLHMTQPPLTRQIQSLENILRVKLFTRNTRNVVLTAAGEYFQREAYDLLTSLRNTVFSLGNYALGDDLNSVRIGLTNKVDLSLIPSFSPLFSGTDSSCLGRLERARSKDLVEQVLNETLDLAIVSEIGSYSDEFSSATLGFDTMMVAMAASHPAAKKTAINFQDLEKTPLYRFSRFDNPPYYDRCERIFRKYGYATQRRLEPKSHVELLSLIASGHGVAFMPASICSAGRTGVVFVPLEAAIDIEMRVNIQILWRTDENRSFVMEKLHFIIDAIQRSRGSAS
jgi:LysR family transcriptional regulator, benzoate and cis,cis-muconate-responsive activator of ben and cat genes